jgi:hypothetical protein
MNDMWLVFSAAVLAASLAHVLIDYHIGLYGTSSATMQPLQAAHVLCTCLVYAWWAIVLGVAYGNNRSAMVSALVVAMGWAVVWNGAVGLIISPPPSSAFPYQDIAHGANILLGCVAANFIWQKLQINPISIHWLMPSLTLGLLVVVCVVQSVLGLAHRASMPTIS